MKNWSGNQLEGVEYTVEFFHELTPGNLRFALLQHGLAAPQGQASYLELGSGHGLTANIIAALNPALDVVGVEPDPARVRYARTLAEEADIGNVKFLERNLEELIADSSLGNFDFIVLHGIYSWVNEAGRGLIRDLIRRNLKPGGVVFVSYNAYPGWSAGAVLQRVLHDGGVLAGGDAARQLSQGVWALNRLKELNAAFFGANPLAANQLDDLQKRSLSYLAGEYLSDDWGAFFFTDIVKALGEAKVSYGGQADLAAHADLINFTPDQRQFLESIPDRNFRETARDVLLNTSFRRDLYLRGATTLPRQAQKDLWNNQRFVLLNDPADVPRKIMARVGEVSLNAEIYDPVLAALASGPQTLAELLADAGVAKLPWEQVTEAVHLLVLLNIVQLALPAEGEAERTQRARALNTAIVARLRAGDAVPVLASPVTGSGIGLDSLSQSLFAAHTEGVADKAPYVRQRLDEKGHNLIKDGQPVTDEAAIAEHLDNAVASFETITLKILKRAGIV